MRVKRNEFNLLCNEKISWFVFVLPVNKWRTSPWSWCLDIIWPVPGRYTFYILCINNYAQLGQNYSMYVKSFLHFFLVLRFFVSSILSLNNIYPLGSWNCILYLKLQLQQKPNDRLIFWIRSNYLWKSKINST